MVTQPLTVFQFDDPTPEKIPIPTRKVQLMAAAKLHTKLKSAAQPAEVPKDPEQKPEENEQPKEEKLPRKKKNKKADEKKPSRKTEEKNEKTKAPSAKKKRKASNGPLQKIYAEYMMARKKEGVSYQERIKMWQASKERSEVVSNLSASECLRRRY